MYLNKTFIAIIPARSGSKGLPDKNIKKLCGKPLMAWSIESALKSKYIDETVVSTDSKIYAEIAKSYGANVPFIRPQHLSKDTTPTFDVIEHVINFYRSKFNKVFDYVVLLEPTSPIREDGDIDNAIEKLCTENAKSIVGICKVEGQHPMFLSKLKNGFICPYINTNFKSIRRQDIDNLYFFEGSIYISQIQSLLTYKNFYHVNTMGI